MGDGQVELMRFVFDGCHNVAIAAHHFNAVTAHSLDIPHAFAAGLRAVQGSQHWVNQKARRHDLILCALFAQLQSFFGDTAHIADGGDAARHPGFQLIFQRLRRPATLILRMGMRVDQAGQHVFSGSVNLHIGGNAAAAAAAGHRIKRNHGSDDVIGNDDVFGTRGRGAVAVGDGGIANGYRVIALSAYGS